MRNIIVTVTNEAKSYFYDIEAPTDIKFETLKKDIVDALNGYVPELRLDPDGVAFFCNRTGKRIKRDDTLEDAGVWNGDHLTIIGE